MSKMEQDVAGDTDVAVPPPAAPPFPAHFLKESPYPPGIRRVSVNRYFEQAYHEREIERLWKKSWQWACREDDIPEVGDYHVYEVSDLSFIVIRTAENQFKAYWNSCPHRARKIATFDGKRASELRCMFHGWAWNIDGSLKEMSCGWDFSGARPEEVKLAEVSVGLWGGYVFINPDLECESLEDFLGELPEHYEGAGHDMRKRWVQVHIVAHLEANWKVVQEAFIENWHVAATHPQLLRPPSDGGPQRGSRWDDFGNWMRSAPALPSDKFKTPPGSGTAAEHAQQYLDHDLDYHLNEESPILHEPGTNPGAVIKNQMREDHRAVIGDAVDAIHDMHMSAGEMVSVWPNFHPWGGLSRLTYRFRPYKNDPSRSIMDVMLIAPWPEDRPRPRPAKPHVLDFGQPITDAGELGWLARIFRQDLGNMPFVQEGVKTSRSGYAILSSHNETPVRRWHDQYDRVMDLDPEGNFGGGE